MIITEIKTACVTKGEATMTSNTTYLTQYIILTTMCCVFLTLSSTDAMAASSGSGELFGSMTNFLNALETLLTGTWARIVAIIAVVFTGFAWMTGRLSWGIAGSVIGGIILVFGAAAIVDGISGAI